MVEAVRGKTEILSARPQIIVFMGPEGSGKSTLAKVLSRKLGIPYIGTGDMIRRKAELNEPTDIGKACCNVVDHGTYLEPHYLNLLLIQRLRESDTSNGAVIDGALRTLKETQDFDETLVTAGKGTADVRVIMVEVPLPVGYKRARKRKGDRDTKEKVRSRLGEYCKDLPQRLEIIRNRYQFLEIDGKGRKSHVTRKIRTLAID